MSHNSEYERQALTLRSHAESMLTNGAAPQSRGSPLGREALRLLFDMASDSERSSDALRLLHELQVHQVELDMQREELENNEQEMRLEVAQYKAIFKLMPTFCLVTTTEGRVIDANPAASAILKTRFGDLAGHYLDEFVSLDSHNVWREMLRRLKAGEQSVSGELLIGTRDNKAVTLELSGAMSAEGNVLLFGLVS